MKYNTPLHEFTWSKRREPDSYKSLIKVISVLIAFALIITVSWCLQIKASTSNEQVNQPEPIIIPSTPQAPLQGKDSPATTFLSDIVKDLPGKVDDLGSAAVGPDQAQSLPGLKQCPDLSTIAPTASVIRGWAGGNWIKPSGVTLTVSTYGTGIGYPAYQQLSSTRCPWIRINSRSPKISGVVVNGTVTTNFVTWKHADVILSVTSTNHSIPDSLVKELEDRANSLLPPICANMNEDTDESARNPYYNSQKFTGWLRTEKVTADVSSPVVQNQPEEKDLPDITLPTPPAEPYYPRSLPQPVNKPSAPAVPSYPNTDASIDYQVDDPIGPGCGWAFTSTVKPVFNQNDAEKKHSEATAKSKSDLASGFSDYLKAVDKWKTDYAKYQQDVISYETYIGKVYEIEVKWEDQKKAQSQYQIDLSNYNKAVADADTFNKKKQQAQTDYDKKVLLCQQVPTSTPTPTATPTPSETPGATPTAVPSSKATPTPTPTMICPPIRPAILDQSAPPIPPKPTPPDNPIPVGER